MLDKCGVLAGAVKGAARRCAMPQAAPLTATLHTPIGSYRNEGVLWARTRARRTDDVLTPSTVAMCALLWPCAFMRKAASIRSDPMTVGRPPTLPWARA